MGLAISIGTFGGPDGLARCMKKARPRHDTIRSILVSDRHDPIYWAEFGPGSRLMDGHELGSFKAHTK